MVKLSFLEELLKGVNVEYSHTFQKKKTGGKRTISVPTNKNVRYAQKRVSVLLKTIEQSPFAYGSVKGGSVDSCLYPHVGKKYFYEADIKSFFPHINVGHIYYLFSKTLQCSPDVSRILTFLSTTKFKAPQGVSQSPGIANLVLKDFDFVIAKFCKNQGAIYSRYVDNLFFSSNKPIRGLNRFLKKEAAKRGFILKSGKVHKYKSQDNIEALGKSIKQKIGIPRKYKDDLRAILHNCKLHGYKSQTKDSKTRFKKSLESKIKLVSQFHQGEGKRLQKIFSEINWH